MLARIVLSLRSSTSVIITELCHKDELEIDYGVICSACVQQFIGLVNIPL